jgi:hypothetical protein
MYIGCCWESQREGGHWEDQDVGGLIILGCILQKWDGVMWTGRVERMGEEMNVYRLLMGKPE